MKVRRISGHQLALSEFPWLLLGTSPLHAAIAGTVAIAGLGNGASWPYFFAVAAGTAAWAAWLTLKLKRTRAIFDVRLGLLRCSSRGAWSKKAATLPLGDIERVAVEVEPGPAFRGVPSYYYAVVVEGSKVPNGKLRLTTQYLRGPEANAACDQIREFLKLAQSQAQEQTGAEAESVPPRVNGRVGG